MPSVNLPAIPDVGKNDAQTVIALYDTVLKLRKELEYLLYNLDSQNVISAQSATIAEVYAGTIEANKITTANAKIATAQIETLTVGGNVAMGENASISWNKVSGKPSPYTDAMALAAWVASGYRTYIDANGVYTGTVAANKIIIGGANGSISFNDLSDKPTIPTIPGYITSTKITRTTIESPTINNSNAGLTDLDAGGKNADEIGYNLLSTDIRFWAGNTLANRATAPFRVTHAGQVTANNIVITGGSISVATDVIIGNFLRLNKNSFSSGVAFGEPDSAATSKILYDPGADAMIIHAANLGFEVTGSITGFTCKFA